MLGQLLLRLVLVWLNAPAISQNLIDCIKLFSGISKRGWRFSKRLIAELNVAPKIGPFSTANRLQAQSDAISTFLCVSQRLYSYYEAKCCY